MMNSLMLMTNDRLDSAVKEQEIREAVGSGLLDDLDEEMMTSLLGVADEAGEEAGNMGKYVL